MTPTPATQAWIAFRDWIDNTLTEFGMTAEQLLEAEAFVSDIEREARALAADHANLGLWFARVEAALPDGWWLQRLERHRVPYQREPYWQALAYSQHTRISGEGPTPEAALQALHAALTEPK